METRGVSPLRGAAARALRERGSFGRFGFHREKKTSAGEAGRGLVFGAPLRPRPSPRQASSGQVEGRGCAIRRCSGQAWRFSSSRGESASLCLRRWGVGKWFVLGLFLAGHVSFAPYSVIQAAQSGHRKQTLSEGSISSWTCLRFGIASLADSLIQ